MLFALSCAGEITTAPCGVPEGFPYFNPDFNLSITAIPELNVQNDLPIVLENISYDDQYE